MARQEVVVLVRHRKHPVAMVKQIKKVDFADPAVTMALEAGSMLNLPISQQHPYHPWSSSLPYLTLLAS
jgi:hypothetical protein